MLEYQVLKKEKIAIFLPSLRGGGAERVMVTLAKEFSMRGHKVDLVLTKAVGPYLELLPDSIRVIDLKARRVFNSLPGLVRYLRRNRPSAMLSAMGHANIIAIWARMISGVSLRLVVSERNTASVSRNNSTKHRSRLVHILCKWFYPVADVVVAVSQGVADDLVECFKINSDKIKVIYNPVVDPELSERAHEQIQHPWFDHGEAPVILGAGRLHRQKDFTTLIKAFALVRQKQSARLLILGEGEERPSLEGLIRKLGLELHAALPGFVDNPFQYMSQSEVFVLSSAWEGLPGVLIQAMACGAPVVSTDCPSGPIEIFENGKWGRLVPVGDVEAMAEAICATLNEQKHPEVRKRAADFGVDKAVDSFLRLLCPPT
jgi:glycosyltransferase involved in cell wall biosynthesis